MALGHARMRRLARFQLRLVHLLAKPRVSFFACNTFAGRLSRAKIRGNSYPVMNVHVVEPTDSVDQLQMLQDQRRESWRWYMACSGMDSKGAAT